MTASLTLCQYCEHANPEDAKFCAGCGAPLHLIPCPHCGSVNQKTSKTCYQCHGELRESTEILLANTPASPSEVAAGNAQSVATTSYPYVPTPPTRQRQPIYVVAIIFVAFAAAAYFAYQQRSVVTEKTVSPEPVVGSGAGKTSESTPANLSAGTINKASPAPPVLVPAPALAEKAANPSVPTPVTEPRLVKSENIQAVAPTKREPDATARTVRRRVPVEPPVAPTTAIVPSASASAEKPAPKIGICTEGVAALGLCTPEPTKGR